MLQEMLEKMEPIQNLWKTAYKFDKCHELWWVLFEKKWQFVNFVDVKFEETLFNSR